MTSADSLSQESTLPLEKLFRPAQEPLPTQATPGPKSKQEKRFLERLNRQRPEKPKVPRKRETVTLRVRPLSERAPFGPGPTMRAERVDVEPTRAEMDIGCAVSARMTQLVSDITEQLWLRERAGVGVE